MTEFTYARWKAGESRESKIFEPLQEDHPLIEHKECCNLCSIDFKEGDLVQLLVLGADSEENKEKLKQGRWISALAIVFHTECMTGKIESDAS